MNQEADMKQEQQLDKSPRANFFDDVSQDVSQQENTVVHMAASDTGSAGGSVNLLRVVFSQRLKDARDSTDDPGRGLPSASYFQTDALAAKKIRPTASSIRALLAEVFKGCSAEFYRQVPEGGYQAGTYGRCGTEANLDD